MSVSTESTEEEKAAQATALLTKIKEYVSKLRQHGDSLLAAYDKVKS